MFFIDLLSFIIFFVVFKIKLFKHPLHPKWTAHITFLLRSTRNIGAQSAVKIAKETFFDCVILPSATIFSFILLLSIISIFVPCI